MLVVPITRRPRRPARPVVRATFGSRPGARMTTMTDRVGGVILGVDTHEDVHVASVIDEVR
jgi:hypothetical protein